MRQLLSTLRRPPIDQPLAEGRDPIGEAIFKGDAARHRQDWFAARRHYGAVLSTAPLRSDIWIQYGHALKESGALEEALAAYQTAIAQCPQCADGHLQLGHVLKRLGRTGAAEAAYLSALKLDGHCLAARLELSSLGWSRDSLDREAPPLGLEPTSPTPLSVDVSDLVRHFGQTRSMTGIQRVQLNLVEAFVERGTALRTVCFRADVPGWIDLPSDIILRAGRLARRSCDANAADWTRLLADLEGCLACSAAATFARGSILLNLGTSWWLRNYFLAVRELRSSFGVRYVPFVHDLIPLVAPEHCTPGLRRDFLDWLAGVFDHADLYLTNSQATREALLSCARELGRTIVAPAPIRLDGIVPVSPAAPTTAQADSEPFVLFVSTIESRKNHDLAFATWARLIRQRGVAAVPRLVCVGAPGWMVELAMARLTSDPQLAAKVSILNGVDDRALADLYDRCLFTLYPSQIEGWGLPVTESLAHGKVPLVAEASSLPEAGGPHAAYFDLRSERDFERQLIRLIDDTDGARSLAETRIRQEFHRRSWSDVAGDLMSRLGDMSGNAVAHSAFEATPGVFYDFRTPAAFSWPPALNAGERFRSGLGWGLQTARGSDAGPGARIEFAVPADEALVGADYQVYVAFDGAADEAPASPLGPSPVFRRARLRLCDDRVLRLSISPRSAGSGRPDGRLCVAGFLYARCDDAAALHDIETRILFGEIPDGPTFLHPVAPRAAT